MTGALLSVLDGRGACTGRLSRWREEDLSGWRRQSVLRSEGQWARRRGVAGRSVRLWAQAFARWCFRQRTRVESEWPMGKTFLDGRMLRYASLLVDE